VKRVLRFDVSRIDAPRVDHNGYLEAAATVTRAGVFVYRHADGSQTRELRHPDEVFKKDSLKTLRARPVTAGHPGRLTPKNTRQFAIGSVVGDVEHDETDVNTRLQVMDADTITRMFDKEFPLRQISCGYDAEVVKQDGEYVDPKTGKRERYDHVQKNIVYNHVALVPRGRAGPDARIHLDAADAFQEDADNETVEDDESISVPVSSERYETSNVTTRAVPGVDGVQVVYTTDRDESVIRQFIFTKSKGWGLDKAKDYANNHRTDSVDSLIEDKHMPDVMKIKIKRAPIETKTFKADAFEVIVDGSAESAEKAVDAVQTRLDAAVTHIGTLEAKNQELQGRLDAAGESGRVSHKQLHALTVERADACGAARAVGLKNFEALETDAIKKMVVLQAYPDVRDMKQDEITPSYIQGRYDAALAQIKRELGNATTLAGVKDVIENPGHFGMREREDAKNPRDSMIKDTAEMWRNPKKSAEAMN
jgi:hypothetical protein